MTNNAPFILFIEGTSYKDLLRQANQIFYFFLFYFPKQAKLAKHDETFLLMLPNVN